MQHVTKSRIKEFAARFDHELSYLIFCLIVEFEQTTFEENPKREILLQAIIAHTVLAFETIDYDFVEEVEDALEENLDMDALCRWADFFEARGCCVDDPILGKSQIFLFPVLTASNYGVPHGKIPENVLALFYDNIRALMPENFEIRLNTDFVNEEVIHLAGWALHKKVKDTVQKTAPGICTFLPSTEREEDLAGVLADMKFIVFILTTRPTDKKPKLPGIRQSRAMQKKLTEGLQKELARTYLATRFWFPTRHDAALKRLLKSIQTTEPYIEDMWLPAPFALYEAEKLFRHLSLETVISNLKEENGLPVERLQVAVSRIFESNSQGQSMLVEYRLGFGDIRNETKVLFGIVWPIFGFDEKVSRTTLFNSLAVAGFLPEQIAFHDKMGTMLNDNDELYPNFKGQLVKPIDESEETYNKKRVLN